MRPFLAEGGNTKWKTQNPRPGKTGQREDQFDHYFVKLTPGDYRRLIQREGVGVEDVFIVNGTHYMIGRKAARYGSFDLQFGERRYTELYYGVLAAIAMARGFGRSTKDIFFVGSHPPKDADYADDLMAAVVKQWTVEWKGERIDLDVVDATTFDEPLGGWAHAVFRADGRNYANQALNRGVTLVIDIGGVTTDGIVIDPGGAIDVTSARSEKIGVLAAVDQFKTDFRTEHRNLLKGVELDDAKAHEAIRTGVFDLRGMGKHDCGALAREIKADLLSQVLNFYASYGGAALYDTLLLTGGGSGLLERELRGYSEDGRRIPGALRHNNILLAERASEIHLANARGGLKWYLFNLAVGTYDDEA